jgi:hypothetical protein
VYSKFPRKLQLYTQRPQAINYNLILHIHHFSSELVHDNITVLVIRHVWLSDFKNKCAIRIIIHYIYDYEPDIKIESKIRWNDKKGGGR